MKKITLGIADDNREFCEILTDYFAEYEEIEVAFVCHDGLKTLEYIRRKQPDILILDMVTGAVSENYRVVCRRAGTDHAEGNRSRRRVLYRQAVQS